MWFASCGRPSDVWVLLLLPLEYDRTIGTFHIAEQADDISNQLWKHGPAHIDGGRVE
jgi:hypothetical protein